MFFEVELICRLSFYVELTALVRFFNSRSRAQELLSAHHTLFIRVYGAYAYFSGNDETKFSKKLKFS